MPRFSANLGHLFVEYPLIERIGHAAKAGFKAIELQNPYELAPSAVKAEIDRHGLTMLNLNTPPGRDDEPGLAAVAGREEEFWITVQQGARLHRGDRRQLAARALRHRAAAPAPRGRDRAGRAT